MLIFILNIINFVFRTANSKIKLRKNINLKRVITSHQDPLSNIELPHFIKMIEQQWILYVLLNHLLLHRVILDQRLEFQHLIDTIYSEPSCIITRLDNPNILRAVRRVLRKQTLQRFMVFDDSID